MKLNDYIRHIEDKYKNKQSLIKKEFKHIKESTKDPIMIGITGSRGKSTTAYLLHQYIKSLGYKSILYSSIEVDSPAGWKLKHEPYEQILETEEKIYDLIVEAKAYEADFIIVEVHEFNLENDYINKLPFDLRIMTNLNPKHNSELFNEDEYVNLKKKFFKDIEKNCKCILGIQDYSKELLNEFCELNENKKYLYTTQHIAEVKDIEKKTIHTLLTDLNTSLDGMSLSLDLHGKHLNFDTKLIMPHNAINLIGVITILDILGIFDLQKFRNFIKNIKVPGRAFLIKTNNRYIVIDYFLNPTLETLKKYQQLGLINKIRVVVGSIGTGFETWNKKFSSNKFNKTRKSSRMFAMSLINSFADYVYLTENDNAAESVIDICNELEGYLSVNIGVKIIPEREKAIECAIKDSLTNDVVLICGRGERKVLCNGVKSMRIVKDRSSVKNILDELEWYYHE